MNKAIVAALALSLVPSVASANYLLTPGSTAQVSAYGGGYPCLPSKAAITYQVFYGEIDLERGTHVVGLPSGQPDFLRIRILDGKNAGKTCWVADPATPFNQ